MLAYDRRFFDNRKRKYLQAQVQEMQMLRVHGNSEFCTVFNISYFFFFYFIFKLYNIEMNPPQVYLCSPSWTLLLTQNFKLSDP